MAAAERLFLAQRADRRFAVHDRHLQIHQENIKAAAAPGLQRQQAVIHRHALMAEFFQQAHRQQLVHGVIFRQQNAHWRAVCQFRHHGRYGRGLLSSGGFRAQRLAERTRQLLLIDRLIEIPGDAGTAQRGEIEIAAH